MICPVETVESQRLQKVLRWSITTSGAAGLWLMRWNRGCLQTC